MLKGLRIGFAMCGSFCTFSSALPQMERLKTLGADIIPIMSEIAAATDTRFGASADIKKRISEITGREPITSIKNAEPIGPKKLLDLLLIAPATGNTIAKLANAITDSSVTMAAKAALRNSKPVVICSATNDGLSSSARNIGILMNTKGIYIVPLRQDDFEGKPTSIIADFELIVPTIEAALRGKQLQPVI